MCPNLNPGCSGTIPELHRVIEREADLLCICVGATAGIRNVTIPRKAAIFLTWTDPLLLNIFVIVARMESLRA